MKKTDFDNKLKNFNKKVTANKTKHLEAIKELTDLTNKVAQISEKWYGFLLGRMYFTGDNGYQDFLVFMPMFSSIILDGHKKLLTGYRLEYHLKKSNDFIVTLNRPCLI